MQFESPCLAKTQLIVAQRKNGLIGSYIIMLKILELGKSHVLPNHIQLKGHKQG